MAVFIEANYSKKLGLPQYSSHQYSVTIRTELTDVSQLAQASADLYAKLQQAVDTQISNPGLMPGDEAIHPAASPASNASAHHTAPTAATPSAPRPPSTAGEGELDGWKCSDRQRELILKIVDEHRLDKTEVDALARKRYSVGVKQLNKLQASGLIDELLETHGKAESTRRGNFRPPSSSNYGRNRR